MNKERPRQDGYWTWPRYAGATRPKGSSEASRASEILSGPGRSKAHCRQTGLAPRAYSIHGPPQLGPDTRDVISIHQHVAAMTIRNAQAGAAAPGSDVRGFGTALMPFS